MVIFSPMEAFNRAARSEPTRHSPELGHLPSIFQNGLNCLMPVTKLSPESFFSSCSIQPPIRLRVIGGAERSASRVTVTLRFRNGEKASRLWAQKIDRRVGRSFSLRKLGTDAA